MPQQLKGFEFEAPATDANIKFVVSGVGKALPEHYLNFLKEHDGGEGFIGENYIILWKAMEIGLFNKEYEVTQYAPGIILFGSSGGGEGYGFDTKTAGVPIVRIPFIGMDRERAEFFATNMADLFENLASE